MTARKTNIKAVEEVEYDDLFSELLATIKVPAPLVIAPGIVLECPTKKQVNDLMNAETEVDAQTIIFGDQFDAAMELFDGMPLFFWNKFMERYNEHFFGDADTGK